FVVRTEADEYHAGDGVEGRASTGQAERHDHDFAHQFSAFDNRFVDRLVGEVKPGDNVQDLRAAGKLLLDVAAHRLSGGASLLTPDGLNGGPHALEQGEIAGSEALRFAQPFQFTADAD